MDKNSGAPLFSVIVPVYNAAEYIDECLQSALNQTCTDFELILVDDGSPDNCGQICDLYALSNPDKVKVIHQINQGALMSRINGSKASKGQYIIYLDSDDMLRKDALEVIEQYIEKTDAELVLFNASTDEKFEKPFLHQNFKDGCLFKDNGIKTLQQLLIAGNMLNSVCLRVVSRKLLIVPDDLKPFCGVYPAEDLLQNLWLYDVLNSAVYCGHNLYFYRIRVNSGVNSLRRNRWKSRAIVGNEILQYSKKWEKGNDLIALAIKRVYRICAGEIAFSLASNLKWKDKESYVQEILNSEILKEVQISIKFFPIRLSNVIMIVAKNCGKLGLQLIGKITRARKWFSLRGINSSSIARVKSKE